MSKIALKMVEEMQLPWEYGQSFHPYSMYWKASCRDHPYSIQYYRVPLLKWDNDWTPILVGQKQYIYKYVKRGSLQLVLTRDKRWFSFTNEIHLWRDIRNRMAQVRISIASVLFSKALFSEVYNCGGVKPNELIHQIPRGRENEICIPVRDRPI